MIRAIIALFAGVCLAAIGYEGIFYWAIIPGLAFLLTALFWKEHKQSGIDLIQAKTSTEKPAFMLEDAVHDEAETGFDHKSRMQFWEEAERQLDLMLTGILSTILSHYPKTGLAYVFFRADHEGQYFLRKHAGFEEHLLESIDPKVLINQDNAHLFSILFKQQAAYVIEGDLSRLAPQPHYAQRVDAMSTLAVPILFGEQIRGLLCLDSLEEHAYSPADVSFVANLADLLAQGTIHCYQSVSDHIQSLTDRTMLDFERQLLQCDSVQEIQRYLARAIDRHLPFDRLLFLEPDPERPGEGRVLLASGIDAEEYQNLRMRIEGRGLLSLVFQNGSVLHRRFRSGEIVYRMLAEEPCTVEMRCMMAVPILGKDGKVQMVVSIESFQIADYAQSQKELFQDMALATGFALVKAQDLESQKRLANQDSLTKLINHRHFHELHQEMHQQCKQDNRHYSLLLCGIDGFKGINERFGHGTGDEVLQAVAAVLYGMMDVDKLVLARFGGDEFAILLPDCGEKWAIHLGQEICQVMSETNIPLQPNVVREGETFVKVSISVGCTIFQARDTKSRQELLQEAAEALLAAKRPDADGRKGSRVVVFR